MSESARYWRAATRAAAGKFQFLLGGFLAFAVLVSTAAVAPEAEAQQTLRLSATQKSHVLRIQSYLNRITTMQARFIQTSPDGNVSQGTLSIKRPGNFRFEYDPPVPHTLISNGTWFIHVDRELKESNFLPLDRTPARFLLSKHVRFDKEVRLIGFQAGEGLIHLKLLNPEHPDVGYVVVTFDEQPLRLRQWTIYDTQNKRTRITLQNTRFGLRLKEDLFEFVEPEIGDPEQ